MTALTDLLAEQLLFDHNNAYAIGTERDYYETAPVWMWRKAARLAVVIEAHYATELDRARAEALEEAAVHVESMEPFAHGKTPTSKAFLVGWGVGRKRALRVVLERAATYRTEPTEEGKP